LAIFTIFLFEFIGNNFFNKLQNVSSTRSGHKYIDLLRLKTFVRPVCRASSTVICIVLLYNLLLSLGVPTNAVLALSAVPGLAIGLGASKLLGNLISGLAMQADQHLNVGNFCRVGDTLGYVKRVGLRSIDIQSFEGCVTIPNAFAEGTNVINYSSLEGDLIKQSLNLKIDIDNASSPWQKKELIRFCQKFLNEDKCYSNPIVSIDKEGAKTTLVIYALILNKDWKEYLELRDKLSLKTSEVIGQVSLSRFVVGVSYDTTSKQLSEIPELIKEIVNEIDDLEYDGCKFSQINQFSYDFVVCIVGELGTYSNFLKTYDNLNKSLIAKFAEKNIKIPFPTTTFDQKN
jgi:MscS family membrane protein